MEARPYDPSSTARVRGYLWGVRLHYVATRPLRPWPAWEDVGRVADYVRRVCKGKVADLARDPEQLELLARVCSEGAARGYLEGEMRVGSGGPPVYVEPGMRRR